MESHGTFAKPKMVAPTPAQGVYSHLDKLTAMHKRLEHEAESIRKWRIGKEFELSKKNQAINDLTSTIEQQKNSLVEQQSRNEKLECHIRNEHRELQYVKDEITNTRSMIIVLKEYAAGVEEKMLRIDDDREALLQQENTLLDKCDTISGQFEKLKLQHENTCIPEQNKLNNTLAHKEKLLIDKQSELEKLNLQFFKLTEEAASREKEITNEFERELSKCRENANICIKKFNHLKEEHTSLQTKHDEYIAKTSKEIETLRSSKSETLSENERIKQQVNEKSQELQEFRIKFDTKVKELNLHFEDQLKNAEVREAQLRESLSKNEAEIAELNQTLNGMRVIEIDLTSRNELLKSKNSEIALSYSNLENELDQLQSNHSQVVDDFERKIISQQEQYHSENESLKAQLVKLEEASNVKGLHFEKSLHEKDLTISQLNDSLQLVKNRLDLSEEELATTKGNMEHIASQKDNLNAKTCQLEEEHSVAINNLNEIIESLNMQLECANSNQIANSTKLSETQEELESLKTSTCDKINLLNDDHLQEITRLKDEYAKLQGKNSFEKQESESKISALRDELNSTIMTLEQFSKKILPDVRKELEVERANLNQLRKAKSLTDEELIKLRADYDQLTLENEHLKSSVNSKIIEIGKWKCKSDEILSSRDEMKLKFEEISNKYDILSKQCLDAHDKLQFQSLALSQVEKSRNHLATTISQMKANSPMFQKSAFDKTKQSRNSNPSPTVVSFYDSDTDSSFIETLDITDWEEKLRKSGIDLSNIRPKPRGGAKPVEHGSDENIKELKAPADINSLPKKRTRMGNAQGKQKLSSISPKSRKIRPTKNTSWFDKAM